jgi:hypothetical protein
LSDFNFYNLFVYDPVHIYANFNAAYEYCHMGQFWDVLGSFASLNYAFIGEIGTRQLWAYITDVAPLYEKL